MTLSAADFVSRKVVSRDILVRTIGEKRDAGEKVVFTNGCFDILHVGHIRYLAEARALGDILVVGLNSDASVRALKGARRPLVPQDERAEMLAALESVSFVCIFDESRPDELIRVVRPAVHVKGGDYRIEDLPERVVVEEVGGRIVTVACVEGISTTNLVHRILDSYTADAPGGAR